MPSNTKKILIFSTSYLPHIGGAETAIKGVTDQIHDYEFDLITARQDDTLAVRETIGNINVFRVGTGGKLDKQLLMRRGLKKAVSLHRDKNYDLVFALMASYGGLTASKFKQRFPNVPMLLNLQEGRDFGKFNFIKARVFKKIVQTADMVVSISEHLKNIALLNGFNGKKISIIPNGVDLASFSQEFSYGELSGLSDSLGIKPGEKVIVTASRLTHKNAIDDLIKAMAILARQYKDHKYKLVILGDGKDRSKLVELTRDLNLVDDVVFAGTIENSRLPKYLRIADVFVRPSRSEGLGSAFLEAIAAGTPVIATPVGGIPDFLRDRETGLFCEVNNPASVAEKIRLMTEDDQLQHHIIKEAYRMVAKNYDWKKIAANYEEVFNSMIQSV